MQRERKPRPAVPGELRVEGTEVSPQEGAALLREQLSWLSSSPGGGEAQVDPKAPFCAKSETPPLPWLLVTNKTI